jgi:hypothetical protein
VTAPLDAAMPITYQTWFNGVFNEVAAASTSLGSSATDPIWLAQTPILIDYAEQRCFKDLDLLAWKITDASAMFVIGNRVFALPTTVGTFRRVDQINVLTPLSSNSRQTLIPMSRSYVDTVWSGTATALPQVYAVRDAANVIVGPTPDQAYNVEVVGTQTPVSLSAANPTTFLTNVLSDLFFSATMVRAAMFMRDDGLRTLWETTYMAQLKSADMEEASRKYRSQGWTAQPPTPVTQPPRV